MARTPAPREAVSAFHRYLAAGDYSSVAEAVDENVLVHSPVSGRGRHLARRAAERCFLRSDSPPPPQPRPCCSVVDGDLVGTCYRMPQPLPDGSATEFFWIDAVRVVDGSIVEWWPSINEAAPTHMTWTEPLNPRRSAPKVTLDPTVMKQMAIDFYRRVFDSEDPGAVAHFVTQDYKQHAGHLPPGRKGLEDLATQLFPHGPRPMPEPMTLAPLVLAAEGDIVLHGVQLFQRTQDAQQGATYPYIVFDAYRVRDGQFAEHWSGINPAAPPLHLESPDNDAEVGRR